MHIHINSLPYRQFQLYQQKSYARPWLAVGPEALRLAGLFWLSRFCTSACTLWPLLARAVRILSSVHPVHHRGNLEQAAVPQQAWLRISWSVKYITLTTKWFQKWQPVHSRLLNDVPCPVDHWTPSILPVMHCSVHCILPGYSVT